MAGKRKLDEAEEEGLSLQDVINEDRDLEATADAVLGGSDPSACTFADGYVGRQAVFACNTCCNGRAGVCLACSLECHKGHELFELYTKRNFRCDCGNASFDRKCKFMKKPPANSDNVYNHNFEGLYCTCNRPYPDPDDDIEDEMIQCVVCEDWYHGRHLGATVLPRCMEFSEMVCFGCTKRCRFLHKYSSLFVAPNKVEKVGLDEEVEVEIGGNIEENGGKGEGNGGNSEENGGNTEENSGNIEENGGNSEKNGGNNEENGIKMENEGNIDQSEGNVEENEKNIKEKNIKENEINVDQNGGKKENGGSSQNVVQSEPTTSQPREKSGENSSKESGDLTADKIPVKVRCKVEQLRPAVITGATFWPNGWRRVLCKCEVCLTVYEEEKVGFLTSEEDTVKSYEEKGRKEEVEDSSILSGMPRSQQVEMIHGFNEMKDGLRDYLRKFADEGKVVTKNDINTFFDSLKNKKRRMDFSYNCR